jgi:hypothetical protein
MSQRLAEIAGITIVIAAIGAWQLLKFTHQYGLFYRLSPEYGGWILAGSLLAMYAVGLLYLLRDKK